MEQMQRGGRQIPNIDSLHSSAVIKAQLDGGSCRMGEWRQCEQDLDIELRATLDRCRCCKERKKKKPTSQTADKHDLNVAPSSRQCPRMFPFACSAL